ncbi:MAG: hypothetical protein OdinLCB4_002800 [Candidatus Odinarchaeum yellowstonii]|uniref:Uncharacterized protein n=1 Tax=Odinarchaeota yellowstonii (strain LCB_4) TaxID=1841599 RepID=A0AAF0D381_ODILC|nr:MAG: hypothetical protein OdinLCB4_002800 [Candidatus Odinarchaeum yellowstonii]
METKNRNIMILGTVIMVLLTATPMISTALAQASPIYYSYQSGQLTLQTDKIIVRVTGLSGAGSNNMPHIIFWNPDDNNTIYHLKFIQLIEFIDSNGDQVFQYNEIATGNPVFSFASSQWNFSGFVEEENGVSCNFTLDSSKIPVGILNLSDFEFILAVHIYSTDHQITVAGENTTINALYEVKVDIIMKGWDWKTSNPNTMLALRVDLTWQTGAEAQLKMGLPGGHSIEAGTVINQGEEKKINNTATIQEQINFTGTDSETLAYFKYIDVAEDDLGPLNVTASYATTQSGLKIYLCYPKWTGTLVHDPTVGVTENILSILPFFLTPIFLILVSVVVVSAFGGILVLKRNGKL